MLNKIFFSRKTIALLGALALGAAGTWLVFQFMAPVPVQREISRPLTDFLPQPALDPLPGSSLADLPVVGGPQSGTASVQGRRPAAVLPGPLPKTLPGNRGAGAFGPGLPGSAPASPGVSAPAAPALK